MKYVYYNPDTKDVTTIAPFVVKDHEDPYIEMTIEERELLIKNNVRPHLFYVDAGRLFLKPDDVAVSVTPLVNGYWEPVPLSNANVIDVHIKQYISTKQVHVHLKEKNQTTLWLMACLRNDPHLPAWDIVIPANTEQPVVYTYAGTDQIRFYTNRTYENYLHEQLN